MNFPRKKRGRAGIWKQAELTPQSVKLLTAADHPVTTHYNPRGSSGPKGDDLSGTGLHSSLASQGFRPAWTQHKWTTDSIRDPVIIKADESTGERERQD